VPCAKDTDGDGVPDATDNCPEPNPDQADTDGDGAADACDPDDDGDGASDEAEAGVGTDPARPDSEGDGVRDSADPCPLERGTGGAGCPPPAADDPPAVSLTTQPLRAGVAATLSATATDDHGVVRVTLIANGRRLCTDTAAPYACELTPGIDDIGGVELVAVAVDAAGHVGTQSVVAPVAVFGGATLTAQATPERDERAPFRFVVRGRLALPAGVPARRGCSGYVAVSVGAAVKTVRLGPSCGYRAALPAERAGALPVGAHYAGSAVLDAADAPASSVRAG
jgi:hypothetical protein